MCNRSVPQRVKSNRQKTNYPLIRTVNIVADNGRLLFILAAGPVYVCPTAWTRVRILITIVQIARRSWAPTIRKVHNMWR